MSVADKISVAAELVPASEAKVGEESNSTWHLLPRIKDIIQKEASDRLDFNPLVTDIGATFVSTSIEPERVFVKNDRIAIQTDSITHKM
jgi:hypothetical protein